MSLKNADINQLNFPLYACDDNSALKIVDGKIEIVGGGRRGCCISKIKIYMSIKCPYCEIPEIRNREIIRNEFAWAFPTNIPIVPGHILIAPVRCVATFEELTQDEITALFELREKLKLALIKVFGAEGFNYAWNEGKLAGQSVPHFHLHVLPRKEGDSGITEYEPRKFLYRPGSRAESPELELVVVSNLIKKEIKQHITQHDNS